MDGTLTELREKFERQLQALTETAARLQTLERGAKGPVHYRLIEAAAHQAGNRLSRQIQTRVAREIVVEASSQAACPACGAACRVETAVRQLTSMDGPVELSEARAFCSRCRRSFFPAT